MAGLPFEPSCCLVACGQFVRPVIHTKQVFASGVVAVDFSLDSTVTCSHAGVPYFSSARSQSRSSCLSRSQSLACRDLSRLLVALARGFTFPLDLSPAPSTGMLMSVAWVRCHPLLLVRLTPSSAASSPSYTFCPNAGRVLSSPALGSSGVLSYTFPTAAPVAAVRHRV